MGCEKVMNYIRRYFKISERNSTIGAELRAGTVTFLAMSYVLFVVPGILSDAGLPSADVTTALCVASAIACFIMGFYANFPFALAPGMGLVAYFTYGVVKGLGVSWQLALAAVFLEGVLFLLFSFVGVRKAIINVLPDSVKTAIPPGIGFFLAIIGLQNMGVIVENPDTLVDLGNLTAPAVLLSIGCLILISVLLSIKFKGAILLGILLTTVVAWVSGIAQPPEALFGLPVFPRETFLALEISSLLNWSIVPVVFAFLFVDVFDTAGTLLGVGRAAGFVDSEGCLPGAEKAFTADAVGTMAGGLLGTSTITTYIDSATGVEEGGRTGLTAVVVGGYFLLALFFAPFIVAIPMLATAPALVVVGALLMKGVAQINWDEKAVAIPAFLTVVIMPFSFSIANGISFGICSHVLIKIFSGRFREVSPLLYLLSALLLLYFGLVL